MKLLFVIVNLEKGGAQRVMLNLCHSLIKNHNIEIVALRESVVGYPLDSLNVKTLIKSKVKNRFIRFLQHRKELKKIITEGKYDGVISFLPEANFMICSIKQDSFKIINVRNDPKVEYRGLYYPLMRYFYPKAQYCVVQTETIKQYFEPFIRKIIVIPNPVSEIPINPSERAHVILNAGRLVAQKNQKLLIKSFKLVHDLHPEYECHIFGEGRLKNELNQLILNLGLKDTVKILNSSNSIFTHMQEAEIFVLSSNYEGYPNVLLEAMVCGCAVISTDCASKGPASIIKDNQNGLLVQVNDEKALANAMIRCIDNQTRHRLSESAKQIKYTNAHALFLELYLSILESLGTHYVKN